MNKTPFLYGLLPALFLSACSSLSLNQPEAETPAVATAKESIGLAQIDLRVREDDTAPYQSIEQITVPDTHVIGDKIFPYEGIGWENAYIGYRIYLDERAGLDIFGKRVEAPSLQRIEADTDYHSLADWGMDVLKVGPSRGIGGLGVMKNGHPVMFGKLASLKTTINRDTADVAEFTIDYNGIQLTDDQTASVSATYSLEADSPLTHITASITDGDLPLATGLVIHENASLLVSEGGTPWQYIANYGLQSENKDNLGLALFYRTDEATYEGISDASQSYVITFKAPVVHYKIMGAWEQDKLNIKTKDAFEAYLTKTLSNLNATTP